MIVQTISGALLTGGTWQDALIWPDANRSDPQILSALTLQINLKCPEYLSSASFWWELVTFEVLYLTKSCACRSLGYSSRITFEMVWEHNLLFSLLFRDFAPIPGGYFQKKEKDDATLTNVKFKWWNDINKYSFSPLRVIWGCLVEIFHVFHKKKKKSTPPPKKNKNQTKPNKKKTAKTFNFWKNVHRSWESSSYVTH